MVTDNNREIDIKELFLQLQEQMKVKLNSNRKIISHPGAKGDSSEINWIEWLRRYIPKRYSVDKAFIIDNKNNISDQIDLVIYDQHFSPFVFNQDGTKFIPAESVYAIFEVKQSLNSNSIKYAAEKAKSVRKLSRTSAPIYYAEGCYEPKDHFDIIAGILTLSSDFSPSFSNTMQENILKLKGNEKLDLGCVLLNGAFIIKEQKFIGCKEEEGLIFFFLNLINILQKMGSVPALDISKYARHLDSI